MRRPDTQQQYNTFLKESGDSCRFCGIETKEPDNIVSIENDFIIFKNIFPYEHWDESEVLERLLLIPRKHHVQLDEFSHAEKEEFVEIIARYESRGYSLYARAPHNGLRTVEHQHSHLMRLKPLK